MKLWDIAHSRTGDKGDISNVSLIAYDPKDYAMLCEKVTAEKVKEHFKGIVKGFDNYTIILDCDGKQNIVYKHAVSTIIPVRPISILNNSGEDGEN